MFIPLALVAATLAGCNGFIADPDPVVDETRLHGTYFARSCPAIVFSEGTLEFGRERINVEFNRIDDENVLVADNGIVFIDDRLGCRLETTGEPSTIHFLFDDERVMIEMASSRHTRIKFFEKQVDR